MGVIGAGAVLDSFTIGSPAIFTANVQIRIYFSYRNSGGNAGSVRFYDGANNPLSPASTSNPNGGMIVDIMQVPGSPTRFNAVLTDLYTGLNNIVAGTCNAWTTWIMQMKAESGFASTTDWTWSVTTF